MIDAAKKYRILHIGPEQRDASEIVGDNPRNAEITYEKQLPARTDSYDVIIVDTPDQNESLKILQQLAYRKPDYVIAIPHTPEQRDAMGAAAQQQQGRFNMMLPAFNQAIKLMPRTIEDHFSRPIEWP